MRGNDPTYPTEANDGITIREHFSEIFMCALLKNDYPPKEAAKIAVQSADYLLEKLNQKTNE